MRTCLALATGMALTVLASCSSERTTVMGTAFVKSELIRASEGGTVTVSASDSPTLAGVSITIPPNALAADTRITIGYGGGAASEWSATPSATASIVPNGVPAAGPVVYFGPDGTVFRTPASVTLPFELTAGATVTRLIVYAREGDGHLYQVDNGALQISGSMVSFSIGGLTQFQPAESLPPLPDGGGCESGMTLCPDQDAGYCADLTSDPQNCGGCANACASGQCDGGACVDIGGTTTSGTSGTSSAGTSGETSTGSTAGTGGIGGTSSGTSGGTTTAGSTTGGTTGSSLAGPYVGYDSGPRFEPAIDFDAGCMSPLPIWSDAGPYGYGMCVGCVSNADCPTGLVCDTNSASFGSFSFNPFSHLCVECALNSDCPTGQVCDNDACQSNCSLGGVCSGFCETDSGVCYGGNTQTVSYCDQSCCPSLVTGYCLSNTDCAVDGGGGSCVFNLATLPSPYGFCVGCTLDGGECGENQVCVASLCPNELGGNCAFNCFVDAGACGMGSYCADAGSIGADGGLLGLCTAGCASNANCGGATPICMFWDAGSVPSSCVQCASASDCPDWAMGCAYNQCGLCWPYPLGQCPYNLTCGAGQVCLCSGDSDCPLDVPKCVAGNVDAGYGSQCACTDSSQCGSGSVCEMRAPYGVLSAWQYPSGVVLGGACIPSCATNADCAASFPGTENAVCDTATGFCVPCVTDQDCTANAVPGQPSAGPKCVPFDGGYTEPWNVPNAYAGPPFNPGGGRCGCTDTSECNGGYTCTPVNWAWGRYAMPGVCVPPCTYQNGVDSCYTSLLYGGISGQWGGFNILLGLLYCNTFTGLCSQCLDDYDCPGPYEPFCSDAGSCFGCRNADDCAAYGYANNACNSGNCGTNCTDSSQCPTDGGYACIEAPGNGYPPGSGWPQCVISCVMGDDAGLGTVSDAGNACPPGAPLCASDSFTPDASTGICVQCLGPQDTTSCKPQGLGCPYLESELDDCQGITCTSTCSSICTSDSQCDPDSGYTCLEANPSAPVKQCFIACVMGDDAGLGTVSDAGNACPLIEPLCQPNPYSSDPTIGICAQCLGPQDVTTCKPTGRVCPAGQHEADYCVWNWCQGYCSY